MEKVYLLQHESCDCKCELNKSVCNSLQNRILMNVAVSVNN